MYNIYLFVSVYLVVAMGGEVCVFHVGDLSLVTPYISFNASFGEKANVAEKWNRRALAAGSRS